LMVIIVLLLVAVLLATLPFENWTYVGDQPVLKPT
jgi:hypothetical protein